MPNPKPFKHQLKSLAHSEKTNIVFDCSDPGTGKTFVRIKMYAMRHKNPHKRKCALVLAPKSLLRTTWLNDFKKFEPSLRVVVAPAERREAMFDEPADVYVTNSDAVKWLAKKPKSFFDKFDELIVDESTAFKHHTSQRSKAAAKIAKHFKYRSCMTGTPNSRSITDVWHQVFLLDEGKRLGTSFYAFRNAVCEPKQVGRNKNAIDWVDKDGAEEAVFGLLKDIVIRHKFEDCVDIPANRKRTVSYLMSEKQLKAYEELERTQMLLLYPPTPENLMRKLKGKAMVPSSAVVGVNAAVIANKLLQVASGAVYENPNKYHVVDDGRYKLVTDLVEERDHSLVLFLWQHQRDLLVKEAAARKIPYCVVDGGTPERLREQYVAEYQAGKYQVMFGHPKTVGHGMTLTRGNTTIWASPTYDAELSTQASKRQYRIGQTRKTETITVVAEGTIDERVVQILDVKNQRMTNLLDLFEVAVA